MAMNIDMKVKDLDQDPKFAEIIDKYVPGFSTDKQLKLAYSMTLKSLCKFPQMGLDADSVAALAKELEEA